MLERQANIKQKSSSAVLKTNNIYYSTSNCKSELTGSDPDVLSAAVSNVWRMKEENNVAGAARG